MTNNSFFDKDLMFKLKDFAVENPFQSWKHLIVAFSLLIASEIIICSFQNFYSSLIMSIFLSLLLIRIFAMYHDMMHNAIFAKQPLAKIILKIYGILVLNPPSIWQRSHDHHHRHNAKIYTSDIGSFPMVTKKQYKQFCFQSKLAYRFARHPLTIVFGYFTIFLVGMCLMSFLKKTSKHYDSGLAILVHFLLISILYLYAIHILVFGLMIPLMLSSMLGAYLFYVQHNFPNMKLRSNDKWDYFFAALHSTSYFKMNNIMNWLTGNLGYHHVHHLHSQIPFYNLPKAMKSIPALQNPLVVDWTWKSIHASLELVCWDEEAEIMLTQKMMAQNINLA